MNVLKHIFLTVALLAAAMPCHHADAHPQHGHDSGAAELCAVHTCACHACDTEGPCFDTCDMPQERTFTSVTTAIPSTTFTLFVLNDSRPIHYRAPSCLNGSLVGLRTVQLLT